MGQVLHGCATTTHAVRAALQRSKASLKVLAAQHGLNSKTVAKWRKRAFVQDAAMGPKTPRSTVLTAGEEAVVVAFRRHTLLPLDDCLYALQASIPHLTRSSLHRCLQRHGISRPPEVGGDKPAKQAFKAYPIGFFHIDIAEVRTEEGKLYLWVAIDRTSKYAFAQLYERADRPIACAFLEALIEACPYRLHTILTDKGMQFAELPKNRSGPTAMYRVNRFDQICREHDVEHRLTKPNHPWTNGQVERMNRTLKEATVKRYHYARHDQLREHLAAFLDAYNFAKRLKTLRGLPPYEATCRAWADDPDRFRYDPIHLTSGLNTSTTVYDRFNRWSRRRFWIKLLEALAVSGAVTRSTAIDSTYIKAQRSAFGEKGGRSRRRSAPRGAARQPRSTLSPTPSGVPSP